MAENSTAFTFPVPGPSAPYTASEDGPEETSARQSNDEVSESDAAMFAWLLSKGANVDLPDNCGYAPLHNAIEVRMPYFINGLLKEGANVNAETFCGETPLHLAAIHGTARLVLRLLEKGATKNAVDNLGNTPLMMANTSGNHETAAVLREKGAKSHVDYVPPCSFLASLDHSAKFIHMQLPIYKVTGSNRKPLRLKLNGSPNNYECFIRQTKEVTCRGTITAIKAHWFALSKPDYEINNENNFVKLKHRIVPGEGQFFWDVIFAFAMPVDYDIILKHKDEILKRIKVRVVSRPVNEPISIHNSKKQLECFEGNTSWPKKRQHADAFCCRSPNNAKRPKVSPNTQKSPPCTKKEVN